MSVLFRMFYNNVHIKEFNQRHDVCNFNSETQIISYFKDLLVITCRDYCKLVMKYRNCYILLIKLHRDKVNNNETSLLNASTFKYNST